MKKFTAKFGKMRKAVEWVVYPGGEEGFLRVQCDKRCAIIRLADGKGILSPAANYPSFVLIGGPGCETFIVSPELLEEMKACKPKSGDVISSGVAYIG
jgi:hypothetical protein